MQNILWFQLVEGGDLQRLFVSSQQNEHLSSDKTAKCLHSFLNVRIL